MSDWFFVIIIVYALRCKKIDNKQKDFVKTVKGTMNALPVFFFCSPLKTNSSKLNDFFFMVHFYRMWYDVSICSKLA